MRLFSAQNIDTRIKKISLATIIFILFCLLFPTKAREESVQKPTETLQVSISAKSEKPIKMTPKPVPVLNSIVPEILQKIAWCESNNAQFEKDGSVHRGIINPKDIGKFQINERWNGEEAKRLGFDIYTLEGNTAMALYMYKHQGTTPWNWSKDCWGDPARVWWEKDGMLWSTNKK